MREGPNSGTRQWWRCSVLLCVADDALSSGGEPARFSSTPGPGGSVRVRAVGSGSSLLRWLAKGHRRSVLVSLDVRTCLGVSTPGPFRGRRPPTRTCQTGVFGSSLRAGDEFGLHVREGGDAWSCAVEQAFRGPVGFSVLGVDVVEPVDTAPLKMPLVDGVVAGEDSVSA